MTLEATGTLETDVKVQYLRTIVHRETLRQFDFLSSDVENTDISLIVDYLLKYLAWYFLPCKFSLKKKACNAPLYEKNMQIKCEALCDALN